jgi:phosphoribosylformylglycinamidine synthase
MLRFRGSPALSPFRLEKLLAALRQRVPVITAVRAEFAHFLDGSPTLHEREVLERLLQYGPAATRRHPGGAPLFLVVPRPGTISPGRPRPPTSPITAACTASAGSSAGWPITWNRNGR